MLLLLFCLNKDQFWFLLMLRTSSAEVWQKKISREMRIAQPPFTTTTAIRYKNNGFSSFFSYRTTFVTRLRRYCLFCPEVPQGRICEFHDLHELFSKVLLFPRTYAIFVPASCDESKVVMAVFRLSKNHHFCNSSYFVGVTTTFGSWIVLFWVLRRVFFSSILVNS